MKKYLVFLMTFVAVTLMSCGEEEIGVVNIAEPAFNNKNNEYFQVIKVTPLVLANEEGRVSRQLSSQFTYAKGSLTVKCIKEIAESDKYELGIFHVVLQDANGTPLYDGSAGLNYNIIYLNDLKPGEEKTVNYKVCIKEDLGSSGIITDKKKIKEILGPVKLIQLIH